MKSLMSYVLTKKEKAAIVVLLLLILLTGWYVGIYSPIQERIEAADTTDLEDAIAMEQVKSARIKSMQAEIQENKDADAPVVPSYNNFKEELEELNRIHGQAYDFLFTFNEPEVNGTNIRRSVTVNCSAEDYDAAVEMMREILQGPYRSLIYNISMDSVSAVDADFEPNIKEGRVELTFNMNYFETTEGAESLEGLQVEETQAASGGGLANSDMSNLQRSDLETAAEAAFGEKTMEVTAGKRLKSENGASLVAALLFFVLCGVAASMILAAASASAGKMQQVPVTDQKRFAVESGAAFLRDELSDSKTAVKITDVRVVDSREEEPDYSEEYVYTGGETLDDDSILGSCIKQVYTSLAEEDGQNGSFSEQEGNAQNGSSPETAEQDFTFSVQLTQTDGTQTSIKDLDQLQTAAHLTMDPQYNITVDISDTQTGDDHPENRCERKLTVAAKVHVDEMEEEEEHEETNENGDVISEWTITTTTRITQIYWERGMIEKTHPDTGVSGG